MLNEIDVIIPDKGFINLIAKVLNPIFEKIANKERQNSLLLEAKDILLSKLATIEDLVPKEDFATLEN